MCQELWAPGLQHPKAAIEPPLFYSDASEVIGLRPRNWEIERSSCAILRHAVWERQVRLAGCNRSSDASASGCGAYVGSPQYFTPDLAVLSDYSDAFR